MKKVFLALFLFSLALVRAENQKTINPKPNKVTVYLKGAELGYDIPLTLSKGQHEIIIEGVSPYIDENSLSGFFKGAMVIDILKSSRYPEVKKKENQDERYKGQLERVQDSLDELSFQFTDKQNKKNTLAKEKQLLLNNKLMKGEFRRDSVELLTATLNLLRSRLNEIESEDLKLDRDIYKLRKVQKGLNERKVHLQNLINNVIEAGTDIPYQPIYQVIVTLDAPEPVSGSLSLKYFIRQAGWMPSYDIIAGSNSESINIVSRAMVAQNSGLDWKNVDLTLSTSDPTMANTKPTLNIWNLFFGYPNSYHNRLNTTQTFNNYNTYNAAPQLKKMELSNMDVEVDDVKDSRSFRRDAEPVFNFNGNLLRNEYVIKSKYSIASDNRNHNVVINNEEVPVTLTYMSVPKLDRNAFLMAKISDWEDLKLMPAQARIYFDESFIGTSVVNPETVKDTLYIDLGRDKSISVKRQAIKDKCKEKVLGDDIVHTKTIEITVRNTKGTNIEFEVEDQIPISSDPNIKITLLDKDKAIYNEVTGKLTWKLRLKPKEVEKLVFSYEVKHPKSKQIPNL